MDLYSRLMGIDEVIEYLNEKTNRGFTKDKTIKFIKEKKIPIVFEYEGWGTWEFQHKSGYQSLNIQVNGYFNFRNSSEAVQIFKGFLKEINIDEAIIYQLDSYRIRSNAPDGIAPKEDDEILFKTGGRSPTFSHLNIQNFIKIDNDKVGVLKEDLEEYLNKMQIEHMDNKTKIETLESKIKNLKTENASLIQQLKEAQSTHPEEFLDPKDSAYTLIAILKDLLLNPDIAAYHFKTDNKNSTNKPTQTGLANYIDDMQIFGIKKDNINILLQDANKKLKDANSKAREKPNK